MNQSDYDIIIIGAGPAGCICGIFLKKINPALRVAILEKQVFPREKACGDGLSPGAVKIIQEAGLGDIFKSKLAVSNFCLSLNGKNKIDYSLNRLPDTGCKGYVYPRKLLDHELAKKALACGAELFEGCVINLIEEESSFSSVVTCIHSSEKKNLRAKLLVGADGSNSMVRKYLNIPPNKDINAGVALRGYCNISDGDKIPLTIDILKNKGGAYGWIFPVSATMANIGVGIDLSVYKKKRLNINSEFKEYMAAKQREMKMELIKNSCSGYTLPYGNEMPAFIGGNKVLIGDAASMINPLTGEGIYYAMQAGQMLASHIAEYMDSEEKLSSSLAAFSVSYKKKFEEHYRLNLMLKKILASPFAGIAFKRMAGREDMLDKAMNIIMGNGSHFYSGSFKMSILKRLTGTL